MKLLRALLFGAVLWVLIFFEVSILMFGFGLESGALYYTIHYILAIILAAIVALLYFKKEKSDFKIGVLTGVVFAITGIILDLLITAPLFIKDYSLMLGDTGLWIGILLGILTVGVVGAIKKK